jgi:hypothetical protein
VAAGPEARAAFARRYVTWSTRHHIQFAWAGVANVGLGSVSASRVLLRAGEFTSVGKLSGISGSECNGKWPDVEKVKPENELGGRSGTARLLV